jgi:chaperonin cofactor prefoldin
MDKRVSFLERKLEDCLHNLETVSSQVTAMQGFLQKQFGSDLRY